MGQTTCAVFGVKGIGWEANTPIADSDLNMTVGFFDLDRSMQSLSMFYNIELNVMPVIQRFSRGDS